MTELDWNKAQRWEAKWHGTCVNSYQEETKQISYIQRMGLPLESRDGRYPVLDMQGKSVLDVGGGPYSFLLKCENVKGSVLDPCLYPAWIERRYTAAGIEVIRAQAEKFYTARLYDEVWMYNVLQHVQDPEVVARQIMSWGKIIRIHEWTGTGTNEGHPHSFTPEILDLWFGVRGYTQPVEGIGVWYGVFTGEKK